MRLKKGAGMRLSHTQTSVHRPAMAIAQALAAVCALSVGDGEKASMMPSRRSICGTRLQSGLVHARQRHDINRSQSVSRFRLP
jgi:hypothetical protein